MDNLLDKYKSVDVDKVTNWYKVGSVKLFDENGGACIKYKDKQVAVFNYKRKNEWYACQNLCPHKMEMVLSRGMLGDQQGIPKIACPLHKKTFSLSTGENLNGDITPIAIYPVKIQEDQVYVGFED